MTQSQRLVPSRSISSVGIARRNFLVAAAAAVFVERPMAAHAQQKGGGDKKGKGKGKDKDNEVQIEGTIRQISPQGIYVEGEDRTRYLIGVADAVQVTLQGDVDASFLTPGAFVEFDVELDRVGNPTEEVKTVTFVDASPLNPAGLFQTTVPKVEGEKEGRAAFLVRGRLTTGRSADRRSTGERNVIVKTRADLVLTCKLDGWNFATPGDSLRGNVEFVPQPNTGITHVVGRKLTIRTAKPLKPATAKSSSTKSGSVRSTSSPNNTVKP